MDLPTDKSENEDILAPTRPANRRVDKSVIESVAKLVSRGLTESEACRQLSIRPKSYFNFKSSRRNDERFKELLEKFRAKRVEDLIANIERSATGDGLKQRDWRASKFLLEILDRNRFNTDKPTVEVNPVSFLAMSEEKLRQIEASVMRNLEKAKVLDVEACTERNTPELQIAKND